MITFMQLSYKMDKTFNRNTMNWINCLLYKVLLNLNIFLMLNKNCTKPYLVCYIEAIYIYTDKNHCSIF